MMFSQQIKDFATKDEVFESANIQKRLLINIEQKQSEFFWTYAKQITSIKNGGHHKRNTLFCVGTLRHICVS